MTNATLLRRFTKIAVTVPTATFVIVEKLRRRLGKSRSAVVAMALEEWIRGAELSDADRRYAEGYLRVPESPAALAEIRAMAAQATSHWQAWEPGAPLRAAESRSARPPAKPRRRPRR